MRQFVIITFLLSLFGCGAKMRTVDDAQTHETEISPSMDYLKIPLRTIQGETVSLVDFNGRALLLVNVASECGFTPQYEGLQALYEKMKDSGLLVMGFPANNFGKQEPGEDAEILEFCTSTYGVTFPIMSKISVKGNDIHPLYRYLTVDSPLPGDIPWNFTKFLLDPEGRVVARFGPRTKPQSEEIVGQIEKVLG